MIELSAILFILISTLLGTYGSFILKNYVLQKKSVLNTIKENIFSLFHLSTVKSLIQKMCILIKSIKFLLFALCLYILGAFSTIFAYKGSNLSTIYPLHSLSFIWALLFGFIFLHEEITIPKLLSVFFIFLGSIFLVLS